TLDPDVIKDETKYRIEKIEINKGIDNVRNEDEKRKIKKEAYQKGLIINFNEDYYNYYLGLRKILDDHYISSPEVQRSDAKAIKIVESLYDQFINNYKILPLNVQKEIKEKKYPRKRVVADYIASMTDRYAEEIFTNLNSIGSYYDY
ncbi:hypothetical protein L0P56_12325, partial [Anaerosalibacter bizertensis]|nr:hypothetical protein [Anaerosalibacter bizertensis]